MISISYELISHFVAIGIGIAYTNGNTNNLFFYIVIDIKKGWQVVAKGGDMKISATDQRQIVGQITKIDILNAISWDEGVLFKALEMKVRHNKDAIERLEEDNRIIGHILSRINQ